MQSHTRSLTVAACTLLVACAPAPPDLALPNDNRTAAGLWRNDTLVLHLQARLATWQPDLDVDTLATVMAFAESGGVTTIPGPLIRALQGTAVALTINNTLDSALVVYGIRGGAFTDDTVHLAPGSARELRFALGTPGTFTYWGSVRTGIGGRVGRDALLTGVLVVDPAGTVPDTAERIFVLNALDLFPDDTVHNRAKEDIWEVSVNGRSWPHTERIEVPVGTTARWRWVNASYLPHPMHLHGFHFTLTGKGEGNRWTAYAADSRPHVVTEFMAPGSAFTMEWTPTRAGTWLMHCHMIPHITPFPERADSTKAHDLHDLEAHPIAGMAGLVLGITTTGGPSAAPAPPPGSPRLRLLAQQTVPGDTATPVSHGYVLQRGAEPARDSVEVPGSPLLLTRGQTTVITVVNHLTEATTVHWHGMELESVYDGVAGWSRTGGSIAPLIAPGDSFTVTFNPPRAGTFIYHTHMDEGPQLGTGLYGPLLILEPGTRHDPATDMVFVIGGAVEGDSVVIALNGRRDTTPRMLTRGRPHRLRFINMHAAGVASVSLLADSLPLTWRAVAKDGADLPRALATPTPALLPRIGVGETYDYDWTPRAGDAVLEVRIEGQTLRRLFRTR